MSTAEASISETPERIRVSCLASARIQHPDFPNGYGLLRNRNYWEQRGVSKLTPVGGKMQIEPDMRHVLPSGVCFETKHGSKDLRFNIPVSQLGAFITWYARREDREIDVMSEVIAELGPEEQGPLTLQELEGATSTFVGFYAQQMPSLKPDVTDKNPTLYLNEVYDLELPNGIHTLAKIAMQPPGSFAFARITNIERATNNLHSPIGLTSQALLRPQPTLELPDELARFNPR